MITDHSDQEGKVDGGVQAVTRYLVGAMTNLNEVDLHVISYRYGIDSVQTIEAEGFTKHALPGARFGTVTGYWRDQVTLRESLRSIHPDIVHGQGVGHDGIVAARSRYPSVQTVHGILPEEAKYFTQASRRIRHRLQNRLSEHYCIRHAKHTILISPYVADYWGPRLTGKHYMIPNPIAPRFFKILRNEDNGRILFAGRLHRLKGVIDLIRAASTIDKTQQVKIVLAGSLEDRAYVNQLKAEVGRLRMGDNVTFCGVLDDQALHNEFARAALLVLPSYQETAPMVIQEAMACGVPVVATKVGGIAYQVEAGETGYLVNPGDVPALADRLTALLSDETIRKSFGVAAKRRADKEYRAETVAQATLNAYKQILS